MIGWVAKDTESTTTTTTTIMSPPSQAQGSSTQHSHHHATGHPVTALPDHLSIIRSINSVQERDGIDVVLLASDGQ